MPRLAPAMADLVGEKPKIAKFDFAGEALFDWPDLNHALDTQRLEWPRLRVVSKGETVPEADYTVEVARRIGGSYRTVVPAKLNAVLSAGATLVIDGINQLHPAVDRVASELSGLFRAPVLVNLYASWGDVEGFDLHWDDHEVLVLQVSGSKAWQIHEPTRDWPLWFDVADAPRPTGSPFLEHTLEPGDLLYVPHGWWHMAVASQSPSLHLTFGVTRPTGIDYLNWVVDALRDLDFVRKPLPFDLTLGDEHAREQLQAQLVEAVASIVQGRGTVLDFLDDQDGHARSLARFSLPAAIDGESTWSAVRWLAPRAVMRTVDGVVQLTCDGHRLELPREASVTLTLLTQKRECTRQFLESMSQLSAPDLDDLLRQLAARGLVQLN